MLYTLLGFRNLDAYFEYFLKTLLPTNKTYSYFVDWSKVIKNVNRYKVELSLLNSLRNEKEDTIEKSFIALIQKYPEVAEVLPLLIAERLSNHKLAIYDEILDKILIFEFKKEFFSKEDIDQLVRFCKYTGIFELIRKTKDLYDYLVGVEVGIDTNARKNRSGVIFEVMVNHMLSKSLSKKYKIISQDTKISLYKAGKRGITKHDFVVYEGNHPIAIIEVNFYNISGSKPDSIVGNYINMHREASKRGLSFIWITDGPGWKDMKNYLRKAMEEIEWVLNYSIAKENIRKILSSI